MVCHPLPAHLRRQVEDPVTARIRQLEEEAAELRSRYYQPVHGANNSYSVYWGSAFPSGSSPTTGRWMFPYGGGKDQCGSSVHTRSWPLMNERMSMGIKKCEAGSDPVQILKRLGHTTFSVVEAVRNDVKLPKGPHSGRKSSIVNLGGLRDFPHPPESKTEHPWTETERQIRKLRLETELGQVDQLETEPSSQEVERLALWSHFV